MMACRTGSTTTRARNRVSFRITGTFWRNGKLKIHTGAAPGAHPQGGLSSPPELGSFSVAALRSGGPSRSGAALRYNGQATLRREF